jgi:hypothetical protein
MTCGLNQIDPGACNQPACRGDPLCHDHAALAVARAQVRQTDDVARIEARLRELGCVVPPVQEGFGPGMRPR